MDYGMIGKIEKSKHYAQERDRFQFDTFSVSFRGNNNDHAVAFDEGQWKCDCEFFQTRNVCSHTMALERLLDNMMPEV